MFITRIIEEKKSKFNGDLRVVKTLGMGTYIQADGLTQSGGIVETIWKNTVRRIKKEFSSPENVLILGLGGGTVAKLIKNVYPDTKITGIEIDPIMVELGKKYLNMNETEMEIRIVDAEEYVSQLSISNSKSKFDLIIIDLYNGYQFPQKFETENFLHLARTVLAKNGLMVFNRLYFGDKRPETVKFGKKLEKTFSKVEWFYPEANLLFLCSK